MSMQLEPIFAVTSNGRAENKVPLCFKSLTNEMRFSFKGFPGNGPLVDAAIRHTSRSSGDEYKKSQYKGTTSCSKPGVVLVRESSMNRKDCSC
jgi:hypothetical protein